ATVEEPSEKRRGSGTWVRIVAGGSGIGRGPSVGLEARGEGVAQQHHVADLADLGEPRAAVGVPREAPVADEARGPGVADEEGGDDQLQLVDEIVGQKL